MIRKERQFRQGLEVGAIIGSLLILLLLTLVIPTNEFRARLYFFLDGDGLPSLELELAFLAVIVIVGLAVLAALGAWSLPRIVGVMGGAAAHIALLSAGAYKIIPEFTTRAASFVVAAVAVIIAGFLLWRLKRGFARTAVGESSVTAS